MLFNMSRRAFGAVQKPSGEHKFIAPMTDKRFLSFEQLKPTANAPFVLDNLYRHHNELALNK